MVLRGRLAGLRGVWNQIKVIILTLRRLDLTPFCSNIPPSAVPDFGLVVDRNRRPTGREESDTAHGGISFHFPSRRQRIAPNC